jgi:hypothetical protein
MDPRTGQGAVNKRKLNAEIKVQKCQSQLETAHDTMQDSRLPKLAGIVLYNCKEHGNVGIPNVYGNISIKCSGSLLLLQLLYFRVDRVLKSYHGSRPFNSFCTLFVLYHTRDYVYFRALDVCSLRSLYHVHVS